MLAMLRIVGFFGTCSKHLSFIAEWRDDYKCL